MEETSLSHATPEELVMMLRNGVLDSEQLVDVLQQRNSSHEVHYQLLSNDLDGE